MIDAEPATKRIGDVELNDYAARPVAKFVVAFAIGAFFFLLPIPWQGEVTVPFDIAVSYITENFPDAVGVYALAIIVAGAVLTTLSKTGADFDALDLNYYDSSNVFWALRVVGAVLAPVMFFKIGPDWLHTPATGGFMWGTLVYSVGVIIPIGAVFITIFVELGDWSSSARSPDPS